jgi:hypothetical protein
MNPTTSPVPPAKRHGCFFYGCLSLVVFGLIAGVLLVVAVANAPKLLNRWATGYTETAPTQLERVTVSEAELRPIEQRVAAFQQALEQGQRAQELVLTDREINALIAGSKDLQMFRDKLFVVISNDTIRGQLSWPLEDFGPFKLKGRYLNGEVAFRINLEDGRLGVFLRDVKVKGQTLPGLLAGQVQDLNLAEEFQKDPRNAARIQKFDSIRIEDSKLILRSKPAPKPGQ